VGGGVGERSFAGGQKSVDLEKGSSGKNDGRERTQKEFKKKKYRRGHDPDLKPHDDGAWGASTRLGGFQRKASEKEG